MLGMAAQGFLQTAWGKHGAGALGAAPLTFGVGREHPVGSLVEATESGPFLRAPLPEWAEDPHLVPAPSVSSSPACAL